MTKLRNLNDKIKKLKKMLNTKEIISNEITKWNLQSNQMTKTIKLMTIKTRLIIH